MICQKLAALLSFFVGCTRNFLTSQVLFSPHFTFSTPSPIPGRLPLSLYLLRPTCFDCDTDFENVHLFSYRRQMLFYTACNPIFHWNLAQSRIFLPFFDVVVAVVISKNRFISFFVYQIFIIFIYSNINFNKLFVLFSPVFFCFSSSNCNRITDISTQKRNHSNALNAAKGFVNRAHWPSTKSSISKNRRINVRYAIAALINAPI